jgi:DNA-binding winged helix-turn-helix (wHTH) protein
VEHRLFRRLPGAAILAFHFADMVLDSERRELRSGSTLTPIEPQVFDILEFLIRNRDRVVSRDDLLASVWGGRIVSDSAIAARINAARRAIGDSGEQQCWIRTVARKGFRFVGDVREDAGSGPLSSSAEAAAQQVPSGQEITFCRTKDGVNLAVASVGHGMPLVSTPTWATHLEYDWESPTRARLWHSLAPTASASFAMMVEALVFLIGTSPIFPSQRSSVIWRRSWMLYICAATPFWPYRKEPQQPSLTPFAIPIVCRKWCFTAGLHSAARSEPLRKRPKWQRRGLPSCVRDGGTTTRPC